MGVHPSHGHGAAGGQEQPSEESVSNLVFLGNHGSLSSLISKISVPQHVTAVRVHDLQAEANSVSFKGVGIGQRLRNGDHIPESASVLKQ